jgi:sugar lactone lactonase YvrE
MVALRQLFDMSSNQVVSLLSGLGFAEALRWRNNELWFSDMFRGQVVSWNPSDAQIIRLSQSQGGPEMPGGLGWLPDGDLLVVDCLKRLVLRLDPKGKVSVHSDLSKLTQHPLNDMHVESDGTAWVGGYGFNPETEKPIKSVLYRISSTGDLSFSESGFIFPNGCERYGQHIAVAETFADRISFLDDDSKIVKTFSCAKGSGPDGLSFAPTGDLFVAMAFAAQIERFTVDGAHTTFYKLDPDFQSPGGAMGIFDCAVHPQGNLIAFSSSCLDENYSMNHDTGSISIIEL